MFYNACIFVMGLRHLELGPELSFGVDICLAFVEWMFVSLFFHHSNSADFRWPRWFLRFGLWSTQSCCKLGYQKCPCSVSDHGNKPSIARTEPDGISSEVNAGASERKR